MDHCEQVIETKRRVNDELIVGSKLDRDASRGLGPGRDRIARTLERLDGGPELLREPEVAFTLRAAVAEDPPGDLVVDIRSIIER